MLRLMTKRIDFKNDKSIDKGFTYKSVVASGQTGDTIRIPPMTNQVGITIRLICGAGSGSVEYSLSSDDELKSGSGVWSTWTKGTITGTDVDVAIGPITGLRAVSSTGEVTMELCL